MWNKDQANKQKNKINEQSKQNQTCKYREQSSGYQRGRGTVWQWGEEAKMVKRDQMYSEGWKLNFWWWACCGYTEVEINVVYLKLI